MTLPTMRVYSVPGRLVLDPATYLPLPTDGLDVPRNAFWIRRLRDGDVTTTPPADAQE